MTRSALTAALLTAIAGGGVALAQTPDPNDHAAHHPSQTGAAAPKTQATPAPVDVKKTEKGVTMTFTAPDAAGAARLQKMAEAMRLMHEAMAQ
jgi:hypothetical protein